MSSISTKQTRAKARCFTCEKEGRTTDPPTLIAGGCSGPGPMAKGNQGRCNAKGRDAQGSRSGVCQPFTDECLTAPVDDLNSTTASPRQRATTQRSTSQGGRVPADGHDEQQRKWRRTARPRKTTSRLEPAPGARACGRQPCCPGPPVDLAPRIECRVQTHGVFFAPGRVRRRVDSDTKKRRWDLAGFSRKRWDDLQPSPLFDGER